jgi:hypothetical protein
MKHQTFKPPILDVSRKHQIKGEPITGEYPRYTNKDEKKKKILFKVYVNIKINKLLKPIEPLPSCLNNYQKYYKSLSI